MPARDNEAPGVPTEGRDERPLDAGVGSIYAPADDEG
jgi:hypothetical protein